MTVTTTTAEATDTTRLDALETTVAQLLTRVRALELATRPKPRTGIFIDSDD